MGTCLSRCYPETNTSTNGFSTNFKGNERTVKCEYRRIFRGHRNEESKRWSTPKRQKYTSAETSQVCHSNLTDRCLPDVPPGNLMEGNAEYDLMPISQVTSSSFQVDQNHHLDSNGFNSHMQVASVDIQNIKSTYDSPKNGCFEGTNDFTNRSKKVNELFEVYYEPEQDCILADGIERLCTDLCLPPDDFRVLLLAWHFEAETMCRFTRKEFCKGFQKLKVDSLQSLRSKIFAGCSCKKCTSARSTSKQDGMLDIIGHEEVEKGNNDGDQLYGLIYPSHEDGTFVTEITGNREAFKSIYKWSYRFALDMETGQRTLPLDMAISMWQLVFSKRLLFFENNSTQSEADEMTSSGISQEDLSCSHDVSVSGVDALKEMSVEKELIRDPSDRKTSHQPLDGVTSKRHQLTDEDTSILDSLPHALPLIRSWFQFLFSLKGSLRGITRDTWDMFFTFMESIKDDGSGYNDAEAWPSLFDDFIEWLRDKNADD